MPLKNSVAILTGAGRQNGVGAATARILAQKGCNVLINCLKNKEQAERVVEDCKKEGVDAKLFVADLSTADACKEMANIAMSTWGRADIVVNCLGKTIGVPYENLAALSLSDFEDIILNSFYVFCIIYWSKSSEI